MAAVYTGYSDAIMALEKDLEKYLNDNKSSASDLAKSMRSLFSFVLYGEVHVGLTKKAEFFAKLMRDFGDRFHASEHFLNTVAVGNVVEKYLLGEATSSSLPSNVRALVPVLDAIKRDISKTGLVYSGSSAQSARDKKIFDSFKSSMGLHVNAKRFATNDQGHFHIGAAHGGRLPLGGSTPTTAKLLIDDGFNVGTVRMVVDVAGSSSMTDGGFTIVAGESLFVSPVSGGDPIDLLPIVKKVAAGTSFGADLRKRSSPFALVRPEESTSSEGYNKYFDALIFLP